jgi:CPA2 family monovalent cation:H+ antiporter-2
MEDIGLIGDLAVVAVAAVAGGTLARLLHLPAVVGYLAAGVLIGPHTPGPSGDIEDVGTIADLGVALLMFSLGIQFSLKEITHYRGMAMLGGVGATVGVLGVTVLGVRALGFSTEEAVVAGMAASVSSSMLGSKLLEDRGVIGAAPGRIAITSALVNDLGLIFMLLLIPVMSGETDDGPRDLALALAKALGLLAAVLVIGAWLLPRVLGRIAASRARELFVVTIVALALGTAALSAEAGLSIAFGAFLAGLLISESEYAHRTLIEVLPLREVFAVVFFVAIGMLVDPDALVDDTALVLVIAGLACGGRILLITGSAVLLRYPLRVGLTAAIALGSMGEFSFIVGQTALNEGVITSRLNEAILAAVLVSIVVAPLLFSGQDAALEWARRLPVAGHWLRPRTDAFIPEDAHLVNHAIIVGYTQAGRGIAVALAARNFRYSVIDEDPAIFRALSAARIPCVLGNAEMPAILEQAGIARARVVAITTQDPGQIESIAATARQLNRRIDIVARGVTEESPARLRRLGVARVVEAEFETGQQFVRHTLQRFGVTSQEVQALLFRLRRDRFGDADRDL